MTFRYPDIPKEVSLDFLKRLDADPPGTWLGQPKLDGRRRFAWLDADGWHWRGRDRTEADSQKIPDDLRREFEALPWPVGIGLDLEWCGLRSKGDAHSVWVFDIWQWVFDIWQATAHSDAKRPLWLGDLAFYQRHNILTFGWMKPPPTGRVHLVPVTPNPGLLDLFQAQLTNPLSEGIVVRRADSPMVGDTRECKVNPLWFKVKFKRSAGKERSHEPLPLVPASDGDSAAAGGAAMAADQESQLGRLHHLLR